ncbi:MAG: ABC transporter substrate-binding protein [Actinomycetota bacterium]
MSTRTSLRAGAVVGILALLLVACGGGGTPKSSSSSSGAGGVQKGGTYRTATTDFGFTGAFDPTGEYLGSAFGLYSELLMRTLVTYTHTAGVPGDEIKPDIASTWETSADGLTWTFHLKSGIKFGPPLDREVTSHDIEYAFERINTKPLVAQYGFYYNGTIEGMDGQAKSPKPISGIETPDDHTIIFHLTAPTGDFLYRVAMPATGAIPKEVAGCFNKAGDYGRYVISSGPYMLKGEDQLDASSCGALKPISGYDPDKFMVFVRNPNYDASTDSPDVRENNLDGIVITIDTNLDDIFQKVQAGDLDGTGYAQLNPPAPILRQYLSDPSLKQNLHVNSGDRTWYITMNLLTPPFDDIHVRKAVNYVLDKAALQKAWGGPVTGGDVATTIEPPTVLDATASYDPYPSPNNQGDVQAAMAEMKQSKYDSNHDGKCDADVCNNIVMVNRNYAPWTDMSPILTANLAQIGINVKIRELEAGTAYTTIDTVKNLVPIAANAGWGKDFADPGTFAVLFDSSGISCTGAINYSNVGMTESQAKECGVLDQWNAATNNGKNPLPGVDSEFAKCSAAVGDARTTCWASFDKDLMENVVPWVPYLWASFATVTADSVTQFEYDQFAGAISFTHLAVNNGLDPNQVPVG